MIGKGAGEKKPEGVDTVCRILIISLYSYALSHTTTILRERPMLEKRSLAISTGLTYGSL